MAKAQSKRNKKTKRSSFTQPPRPSLLWLLIPLAVAVFYAWHLQNNSSRVDLPADVESPEEVFSSDPAIQRDRSIFKVVSLPGKGKGMIAVRDIQQGELVIQEKPTVVTPPEDIPESLIEEIYSSWTPSQVHDIFDLSWSRLKDNSTSSGINTDPKTQTPHERYLLIEAIVKNNGVAIRIDKEPMLGVFPRMARLNHACAGAFNMMYSWREEEGELMVYALKDVMKGEELLISYIESRQPREERITRLEQSYGFKCTCPVCSLSPSKSKASDKLLSQFVPLYTRFSRWYKGAISGSEAIQAMRDLWQLSIYTEYYSERGRFAEEAAYVAALHGDEVSTREWSELALKWASIEWGADSSRSERIRYTLDNLKDHPELGKRGREDVGGPLAEWI